MKPYEGEMEALFQLNNRIHALYQEIRQDTFGLEPHEVYGALAELDRVRDIVSERLDEYIKVAEPEECP